MQQAPMVTTDQLKEAAQKNLNIYVKNFRDILNDNKISANGMARVLEVGLSRGYGNVTKKPDGLVEKTLVHLIEQMQDCVFALRAIEIDDESKKMEEQAKLLEQEKTAELPKGDLNE